MYQTVNVTGIWYFRCKKRKTTACYCVCMWNKQQAFLRPWLVVCGLLFCERTSATSFVCSYSGQFSNFGLMTPGKIDEILCKCLKLHSKQLAKYRNIHTSPPGYPTHRLLCFCPFHRQLWRAKHLNTPSMISANPRRSHSFDPVINSDQIARPFNLQSIVLPYY